MSDPKDDSSPDLDDVMVPHDDALPAPDREGHGKMPDRVDADALKVATEQERADAGLTDYAPDAVPAATDTAPPGTSDEAIRAQRGLKESGDSTDSGE